MKRRTLQREAIRQVFREHREPLRPDEVLTYAREKAPKLGIATVYRNLKRFQENGGLVAVMCPSKGVLYESADKKSHYHFYCRECGEMKETRGCLFREGEPGGNGRVLECCEVFLYGLCPACASRSAEASRRTG